MNIKEVGIKIDKNDNCRAYNMGEQPKYGSKDWSTALGPVSLDDIRALFRSAISITFLPS